MTDELRRLQLRRLDEAAHRRGHPLLDEARQRARQHHAETDRIDRPAHDVERARPGVLGGGTDAAILRVRPARSTAAAAPSPNSAEEITSALELRSMRKASVHKLDHDDEHDLARLGARKPRAERKTGHAAGAAAAEHRHAHHRRTETHLGSDARFKARRRDAGRGHGDDDIDIARGDTRAVERGVRCLYEQVRSAPSR